MKNKVENKKRLHRKKLKVSSCESMHLMSDGKLRFKKEMLLVILNNFSSNKRRNRN